MRHRLVGDVEQARVLRFQSSVDRFLRERSVLHFVGPASVGQPLTLFLDRSRHVQPPRFGCALASALFQSVLLPSVPIGRLRLQLLQSERSINLDPCGRYLRRASALSQEIASILLIRGSSSVITCMPHRLDRQTRERPPGLLLRRQPLFLSSLVLHSLHVLLMLELQFLLDHCSKLPLCSIVNYL